MVEKLSVVNSREGGDDMQPENFDRLLDQLV
jgi:hypothetical protein